MEILLVYLALIALAAALAGIFFPRRLIFWCAPEDRNRVMAFTVYFSLSVALVIAFIVVVPEPEEAAPPPEPVASQPTQAKPAAKTPSFTGADFLREVKANLSEKKALGTNGPELRLLSFDHMGASILALFPKRPHHAEAEGCGLAVVAAMVEVLGRHNRPVNSPALISCQVNAPKGSSGASPMGVSHYNARLVEPVWTESLPLTLPPPPQPADTKRSRLSLLHAWLTVERIEFTSFRCTVPHGLPSPLVHPTLLSSTPLTGIFPPHSRIRILRTQKWVHFVGPLSSVFKVGSLSENSAERPSKSTRFHLYILLYIPRKKT